MQWDSFKLKIVDRKGRKLQDECIGDLGRRD